MLHPASQQKIIQILQPFQPERIGVFGSFARGENTMTSDLDILVKFQNRVSLLLFVQIEQTLSEQLGIKVDLVSENAVKNPRLKSEIQKDLIVIYSCSTNATSPTSTTSSKVLPKPSNI